MNRPDVVVIGAGINGLVTACMLAKAGRRVLVLERSSRPGGIAGRHEFHPGYRTAGLWPDTSGFSWKIARELGLERFGLQRAAEAESVYLSSAAGGLLLDSDPERAAAEIAGHSTADAGRYAQYVSFLDELKDPILRFLDGPPVEVLNPQWKLAVRGLKDAWPILRRGPDGMLDLLRLAPMAVEDVLNEWFETHLLLAGLAAPSLWSRFAGPKSPGTAAGWLFHAAMSGAPVDGGAPALVSALLADAAERGVEVRTGAGVKQIGLDSEGVDAVHLENGESIPVSRVAASCDPRHIFLNLLPPERVGYELAHRLRNFRGTGTTAVVHLALNGPLSFAGRPGETFRRVRIGDSLTDLERAFDPAKYRTIPERPILEVFLSSTAEGGVAPEGHQVATLLVHFVPHDLDRGWDESSRERLGGIVLQRLAEHVPGVKEQVVAREILTPLDLEEQYGLVQGHIHHGEHALDQILIRPSPECMHYRTPIPGLFLCGSGTHPGGGNTGRPGAHGARALLGSG